MSNVARLAEANLLDPEKITPKHSEAIESLTSDEVEALISVSQKLGIDVKMHDGLNSSGY
jgi:hypothetical protein